jgi:uncharacterized protein (TIGR00369 family)
MDDVGLGPLLGLNVVHTEADAAVVEMVADERHLNGHGTVHGGAIAALVDTAMGAAVFQEGTAPVTIEMTVTYLEPGQAGPLRAEARVRKRGKRVMIAEVDVSGPDGQAVAHGIGTFTSITPEP